MITIMFYVILAISLVQSVIVMFGLYLPDFLTEETSWIYVILKDIVILNCIMFLELKDRLEK